MDFNDLFHEAGSPTLDAQHLSEEHPTWQFSKMTVLTHTVPCDLILLLHIGTSRDFNDLFHGA